jgi:hypothetical protein
MPNHILLDEPIRGVLNLPEREPVAPPEVRHLWRHGGAPVPLLLGVPTPRSLPPLVMADMLLADIFRVGSVGTTRTALWCCCCEGDVDVGGVCCCYRQTISGMSLVGVDLPHGCISVWLVLRRPTGERAQQPRF